VKREAAARCWCACVGDEQKEEQGGGRNQKDAEGLGRTPKDSDASRGLGSRIRTDDAIRGNQRQSEAIGSNYEQRMASSTTAGLRIMPPVVAE